jgi:glycosyltransferase involved in cell wall biosynthesis
MKIAHLTSAHPRFDTRIFVKMCCTLADAGHDVTLVVADGLGATLARTQQNQPISIVDVGTPTKGNRLHRMTQTVNRIYDAALTLGVTVVHLHDPELLRIAVALKNRGLKVVYDVHEDLPRQLLSKPWLPAAIRPALAYGLERVENHLAKKMNAIVTATPFIKQRFERLNALTIDVCNFPIITELLDTSTLWQDRENAICYIGGITRIRGIEPLIDALPLLSNRPKLYLAGPWDQDDNGQLQTTLSQRQGWPQVENLGQLNRSDVAKTLARSKIGLVTLFPTPNYVDALPVKLFEYMAAGIPVIASDFPLWRQIVEEAQCGLLVDPQDATAIAHAINHLLTHDDEARQMGLNGQQAVLNRYHWDFEAQKLLALYRQLDSTN